MRKLIAPLLFVLAVLFAVPAHAQRVCPDPFNSAPCTAVTASATGTTAAVPVTLPAVSGKTTYICGFQITASATAAVSVPATVTGTISGTLNYNQPVGAASSIPLIVAFNPCVPASAINTAIVVTSGAAGTAGVTAVTVTGFYL
jgi:hypothetical protein